MKNLVIVAAIGKNYELGKDNNLIWHLKEDMMFFRNITIGHHVVMGRKTFQSLPKMLPNRTHIVLTNSNIELPKEVIRCSNIDNFFKISDNIDSDIYVIGGAKIYSELINFTDKMYLTEFQDTCDDADIFFPRFNLDEWSVETIGNFQDSSPKYLRKVYSRK